MEKKKNYNIINWIIGNLVCMLGVAFSTKANFGLSMVAAGPYILHVFLRDTAAWFTQGTAEYVFQGVVLVIVCIILKKFKLSYLLTFLEAVIVGLVLDGWFLIMGGNAPVEALPLRIFFYILGLLFTALGVAFYFRTTWPVQIYDFAVVSISKQYGFKQSKTKFCHDVIMLTVSLILSFTLTHKLTGVGIGTIITTLLNSTIISYWGKLIDKVEKRVQA